MNLRDVVHSVLQAQHDGARRQMRCDRPRRFRVPVVFTAKSTISASLHSSGIARGAHAHALLKMLAIDEETVANQRFQMRAARDQRDVRPCARQHPAEIDPTAPAPITAMRSMRHPVVQPPISTAHARSHF